jgi:hypothetical protein
MIGIARDVSATRGPSRSSTGPGSRTWADLGQTGLSQGVRLLERFIGRRPCFCLGAALSAGIALGWWVKRP